MKEEMNLKRGVKRGEEANLSVNKLELWEVNKLSSKLLHFQSSKKSIHVHTLKVMTGLKNKRFPLHSDMAILKQGLRVLR